MQVRKVQIGGGTQFRGSRTINAGSGRLMPRKWNDFEDVNAVRQPRTTGIANVGGGRRFETLDPIVIRIGVAEKGLVASKDVGLATEAADALNTADERGQLLRL